MLPSGSSNEAILQTGVAYGSSTSTPLPRRSAIVSSMLSTSKTTPEALPGIAFDPLVSHHAKVAVADLGLVVLFDAVLYDTVR